MKRETITIRETSLGWLNKHNGRYYKTAAHALRAVKRDARKVSTVAGTVVTVVSWEPTTPAGTAIVKALS